MPHSNDYANQVIIAEHFTDVMNTVNRIQQAMWRMPESGGNDVLGFIPSNIAAHNGRVYIAKHEDDGGGVDVRDADGGPLTAILEDKNVLRMAWRTNGDLARDEGAFLYGHSDEQHSGFTGFPTSGYWVKIHDSDGNFIRQIVPYIAPDLGESPTHPLSEYPSIDDGVAYLNGVEWLGENLYVIGASSVIEVIEPLQDNGSGPELSTHKKSQWYVWVIDAEGNPVETHKLRGWYINYNTFPLLYGQHPLGDTFYGAWFHRTRNDAGEILTEDLRVLSRAIAPPILAFGDHRVWYFDEDDDGQKFGQILGNIHPPFLIYPSQRALVTPGDYEEDGYFSRVAEGTPCIDIYQDDGGAVEDAMFLGGFTVEDLEGLAPDFASGCINMVRVGDGLGLGQRHATYGVKNYLHEEIAETDEQLGMFVHGCAVMDDRLYIIHSRYSNYPTMPREIEYLFSIRQRTVSEWEGFLRTTKSTVGRFPSATDFKPYVEGVDYVPGHDDTHRRQNIPRQNITQIRNALIAILDGARVGGLFFGWPPPNTYPINYYGFFEKRMRWTYDSELGDEYLWYPYWSVNSTTIPLGGGVASVKGRGRYANPLVQAEQIAGISESLGVATAETEEPHGLAENDYVWIVAGDFSGIYRVTEILSATTFKYVIGEFGLDPVSEGTWIKLPLTWARADNRLAGKTMDDIDIGEVRELADVLERAMSHTHGN